jgi:hypothetical protein
LPNHFVGDGVTRVADGKELMVGWQYDMSRVPRKNIAKKIADIVRPGEDRNQQEAHEFVIGTGVAGVFSPNGENSASRARGGSPVQGEGAFSFTRFAVIFFVFGVGILGIAGYRAYQVRQEMLASIENQAGALEYFSVPRDSVGGAGAENSAGAQNPFTIFGGALGEQAGNGTIFPAGYGVAGISDIFSALKEAGSSYRDFQAMTSGGIGLYAEALRFAQEAPSLILGSEKEGMLPSAKRMQALLDQIVNASNRLQSKRTNALSILFPVSDNRYLSFQVEANRAKAFLDALVLGMETDAERHIAIFLENPAELRPGGGFLGSYIDVVTKKGKIIRMDVRDVSDADRVLERNVVPPKPLQAIVRNWRAADANWFFDFPASAEKTLAFLEQSRLYKDENIVFDGAIGVSGRVLSEVLDITGAIHLADGTAITAGNALVAIQASVQEGRAEGAVYPKGILHEITAILSSRLQELDTDAKARMFAGAKNWFAERDVRLYAKASVAENFFRNYDVAGAMFTIPQEFMGDYLAIDRASIGGDKSNLYVDENVKLESRILEEGKVENRLMITRAHKAPQSAPWWYGTVNQTYFRIHTPMSASLSYASGVVAKKIIPKTDYANNGYKRDPDVARVEATENTDLQYPNVSAFRDREKNVFAGWSRVAQGASEQFTLEYASNLSAAPRDGVAYRFVFEKQSGAKSAYHFEIHAPVGFVFAETDSPVYEYDSVDPQGRVVIKLTFSKIKGI